MKAIIFLLFVLFLSSPQAISITNCLALDTSGKCSNCQIGFNLVSGSCQCPTGTVPFNGQCLQTVNPSAVSSLFAPQNMYSVLSDQNVLQALQTFIQQINSNPSGFLQTYPSQTNPSSTTNPSTQTSTLPAATSTIFTPATSGTSTSSNIASAIPTSTIYPGLSLTTSTTTTSSTNPSSYSSIPSIFVPISTSNIPLVSLTNQPSETSQFRDQNCQNKSNSSCLKCYKGYYIDSKVGFCKPTNPLCQNVTADNQCLSCYLGYSLTNGTCLQGSDQRVNCQTFSNSICVKCYSGYFLNTTLNQCIKTNTSCKTFNPDMTCSQCFTGYFHINSNCILQSQIQFQNVQQYLLSGQIDNFCATKSDKGNCITCQTRYYLNSKGLCELVDPFCSNYSNNGVCNLCYIGYKIRNKICVQLSSKAAPTAEDLQANIKCPYRSVSLRGECLQVNDLCQSWDPITGACTWCWPGYKVQNGACVIIQ